MSEQIRRLTGILRQGGAVFFGGAGVSTASGIPDFRSVDGIYRETWNHPPETILSRSFFLEHPGEFFRFHNSRVVHPQAKPNAAHRALAELERRGLLRAVITQNIDGLHQMAGSDQVLELHGSIHRNYCMKCGSRSSLEEVLKAEEIPRCSCGGIIRPDVVLYEEALDPAVVRRAMSAVREARTLIVGGTSLVVYPAAGMVEQFRGSNLVVINKSPTHQDRHAGLLLRGDIAQVLEEAVSGLEQ